MIINNIKKYIELYDEEKLLFEKVGVNAKKRGALTFDDFYRICMWKSKRQKQNYLKNEKAVEAVSKKVFGLKDEAEKIRLLCGLKGVGIPVASAILTIVYPEKYAIIDIRCLSILKENFGYKFNKTISLNTWLKYLEIMRKIAQDNKITPRQLDMAFFAMHKEKLDKKGFKNLY